MFFHSRLILQDGRTPDCTRTYKHRNRIAPETLEVLEGIFRKNSTPTPALRSKIAEELNLPAKTIKIWFQNRRAKAKRTKDDTYEKETEIFNQMFSESQQNESLVSVLSDEATATTYKKKECKTSPKTEASPKLPLPPSVMLNPTSPEMLHPIQYPTSYMTLGSPSLSLPHPYLSCQVDRPSLSPLHADIGLAANPENLRYSPYRSFSPITLTDNKQSLPSLGRSESSPLIVAATSGEYETFKCLLASGSDPFVKNSQGEGLITLAVKHNRKEILELLLRTLPPTAIQQLMETEGRCLLHLATTYNNPTICYLLLEHGANLRAKDYLGFTPLQIAVSLGHRQIVEMYLQYASLKCRNPSQS